MKNTEQNTKRKMNYSINQKAFILKVKDAENYLEENNANINDYFTAYYDLLDSELYKDIQKPHLQKAYNKIHKRYGYVDKKLFAKVIFNTLENIKKLSFFDYSRDYAFIKREYKYLDTIQKIALAYEISKTFRKTKQA